MAWQQRAMQEQTYVTHSKKVLKKDRNYLLKIIFLIYVIPLELFFLPLL